MKKSVKKLKLHRETISLLDAAALDKVAAGLLPTYYAGCVSSPLKCFYTGVVQTCAL